MWREDIFKLSLWSRKDGRVVREMLSRGQESSRFSPYGLCTAQGMGFLADPGTAVLLPLKFRY